MKSVACMAIAEVATAARVCMPHSARRDGRSDAIGWARLMHHHGIRARQKRRFCRTTDSRHDFPLAPNLLARRFTASAPDRVWLADITYVPTAEGWLYLAGVLDMFSRRVVGWAMDGASHSSSPSMHCAWRSPRDGLGPACCTIRIAAVSTQLMPIVVCSPATACVAP